MSTLKSSPDMQPSGARGGLRNRRALKVIQILSWTFTLIFLVSLGIAIYQAVVVGNPLPLWAWLGLLVVLAVVVGLGVLVVVYRGVTREVGPFNFQPSERLSGELKLEEKRLPAAGAHSMNAHIKMLQGTFQLASGDSQTMEFTFAYDDADWKPPRLDYSVDAAGQGQLDLEQLATNRPTMRQGRSDWVVHLPPELPTGLAVRFGAGKAELKLAGLALVDLQVESGVGELLVDFSGRWHNSLSARIRTGIGDTVVRLPAGIGLRIENMVGFGSLQQEGLTWDGEAYTNNLYRQAPVALDLFIEGGMGKVTLEMVHG